MSEYHKIQTLWLRDPETNHKTLLEGQWARPEFEYLADAEWVFTEKVDGTNIRLVREDCSVRGKTDRATVPAPLLRHCNGLVESTAFHSLPEEMVLYGEGFGAKIQKGGGNYGPEQRFVLFDAWCGVWLSQESVSEIALALDVSAVPEVAGGPLSDAVGLCRSGMLRSKWGDFLAEGLVARPRVELLNRQGRRIITKLKCKDFQVMQLRGSR